MKEVPEEKHKERDEKILYSKLKIVQGGLNLKKIQK
jgi:hypothetical protein